MQSLVILIALALLTTYSISEPICSLDKHLNECGFHGVDEEQCVKLGCCFSAEVPVDMPNCFYKNEGYKFFSLTAARVECGHFGISSDECQQHGCFFSPKFGEPWCFFPNTNIDPELCPEERKACGFDGIGQDDCESRGCCWSPLKDKSAGPTCFFSSGGAEGFATHAEAPGAEGIAHHEPGAEAFGTHAQHEAIEITLHGAEAIGKTTVEQAPVFVETPEVAISTEVEFEVLVEPAEAPESAPDDWDLEEYVNDWDVEEFYNESFEMELSFDKDLEALTWQEKEKADVQGTTSVACGVNVQFEADCLKFPDCYWVPAFLPGDQQCFKIVDDPERRNLGGFWKRTVTY